MKIVKIIYISLAIIILLTSKPIHSENVGKLSRDDAVYYLGHQNVRNFPDSLWFEIINEAFKHIKKGDSLMFSEALKFTLENKTKVLDYISVFWQDMILNETELLLELVSSKPKDDRTWLVHIAWLNSETITNYHVNKLVVKLGKLDSSASLNLSKMAREYLDRYKYMKTQKKAVIVKQPNQPR
jgi:RecA-family ATPase